MMRLITSRLSDVNKSWKEREIDENIEVNEKSLWAKKAGVEESDECCEMWKKTGEKKWKSMENFREENCEEKWREDNEIVLKAFLLI